MPYAAQANQAFMALSLIGLAIGSYYMYKLYRIKARPFWDHWQTGTTFYGSMFSLGALLVALVTVPFIENNQTLTQLTASLLAIGLIIEAIGLIFHAKDLKNGSGEAASSQYELNTSFGKTYLLRNSLLSINILVSLAIIYTGLSGLIGLFVIISLSLSLLVSAYLGRIIFYALVIPTTMPGAFFWKNKGFVDHARESKLADMQQLGVAYERHHKFDVAALMQTIKDTSILEMLGQVKAIVTGK